MRLWRSAMRRLARPVKLIELGWKPEKVRFGALLNDASSPEARASRGNGPACSSPRVRDQARD